MLTLRRNAPSLFILEKQIKEKTMTTFKKWLNTFIDEKGIDREHIIEAEGPVYGTNMIPVQVLITHMENAPTHEQKAIKSMIVKIDFHNADVMDYFKHLSQAIAI